MTKKQIEKKAKAMAKKYPEVGYNSRYHREIYAAAMEMAEWILSNQWVRVEDEMPKQSEPVLIRNKNGSIARATYGIVGRFDAENIIEDVNGWILNDVGVRIGNSEVTHWMPIPPMAEEGGEDGMR